MRVFKVVLLIVVDYFKEIQADMSFSSHPKKTVFFVSSSTGVPINKCLFTLSTHYCSCETRYESSQSYLSEKCSPSQLAKLAKRNNMREEK